MAAGPDSTNLGGGPDLARAAVEVRHLGFLLDSEYPAPAGGSQLLVALRDRPTLEHFDPELVRYWRTGADRRGHAHELSRQTAMPLHIGFTWGKLTVIDRYGIENDFATLGGELVAAEAEPGTTVAIFSSPGPILRLGGHSQDVDDVALELGAFFGRIMVPIDFQPGVEQAISDATPLERYAAFIAFEDGRYTSHSALREERLATASAISAEAHRLATEEPQIWDAGERLLARMGLGPSV